jgi:hypothetical protein
MYKEEIMIKVKDILFYEKELKVFDYGLLTSVRPLDIEIIWVGPFIEFLRKTYGSAFSYDGKKYNLDFRIMTIKQMVCRFTTISERTERFFYVFVVDGKTIKLIGDPM